MLENKKKKKDPFEKLRKGDRRRLLLLGTKVHIMQWALAKGLPNNAYAGVVPFTAFPLEMMKGYVCDAVAVSLPLRTEDFPLALENDGMMTYGIFVHIGPDKGHLVWAHVDNISDADIVRLGDVVQDAPSVVSGEMKHMPGAVPP